MGGQACSGYPLDASVARRPMLEGYVLTTCVAPSCVDAFRLEIRGGLASKRVRRNERFLLVDGGAPAQRACAHEECLRLADDDRDRVHWVTTRSPPKPHCRYPRAS